VGEEDFRLAVENFTINHDQRKQEVEEYFNYAKTYTNDAHFLDSMK
jgi:hypothetical protein